MQNGTPLDDPSEHPLPGGAVTLVVRVGDTVRRPKSAGFVRDLLSHFERHGWTGAPRYLGLDDREVLGFIDGHVAWESVQPPAVTSDESMVGIAGLARQFHDLTAHTALAGEAEVVCHNDLSPRNTVYRDDGSGLRPVAFIDWDFAAPGRRIHDVAHVCWQYVALGPQATDVAQAARRVRLIADAYGLPDRRGLVETILWWQDRCWRGIEAKADAGDPAMARLRDTGAARAVRTAYRWTVNHRRVLESALR